MHNQGCIRYGFLRIGLALNRCGSQNDFGGNMCTLLRELYTHRLSGHGSTNSWCTVPKTGPSTHLAKAPIISWLSMKRASICSSFSLFGGSKFFVCALTQKNTMYVCAYIRENIVCMYSCVYVREYMLPLYWEHVLWAIVIQWVPHNILPYK